MNLKTKMRYAGEVLRSGWRPNPLDMSLGFGALGAMAADRLAHSPMDRTVESYKGFRDALNTSPEPVQAAYMQVFGQAPMTNMERVTATGILNGTIDPAAGDGPLNVETPGGAIAIETAEAIRRQAPELSRALGSLASREMGLFVREAAMRSRGENVRSEDVVAAAAQGGGTSLFPAALGGLAGGLAGAAMSDGGFRRNPDVFRVPRGRG